MRRPLALRLLSATGCALALGCALGDLFAPSTFEELTLTFEGPTTLQVGSRLPFTITVRAGGNVVASPRLRLLVADTQHVALTPTQDTLVGRKVGTTTLTARLEDSILTDTVPTLVTTLKVSGGGGPLQGSIAP
ncbi:MAG: hypothetical protein ACREN5_00405 [Gemmatimonadales bacterium]